MTHRPERARKIARQTAHVSTFPAYNGEDGMIGVLNTDQVERIDKNGPRIELDFFAVTRKVVRAVPINFNRRIYRRHLHDFADKLGKRIADFSLRWPAFARFNDITFAIIRARRNAPAQQKLIALFGINNIRKRFRRLTERDRQHTCGQGVQRASMSCLLSIEDSADRTDSRRRRHIDGLIENNPAVDRLSRTSTTSHRHPPHKLDHAKHPTHAEGRRSSRHSRSDRRTQKTAAA